MEYVEVTSKFGIHLSRAISVPRTDLSSRINTHVLTTVRFAVSFSFLVSSFTFFPPFRNDRIRALSARNDESRYEIMRR